MRQVLGMKSNMAVHALPDWRLTKRTRGSLTGEAYSAAFHQFIIQPTLLAQALRPPSNLVPTPSNAVLIPGLSANAIQPALSAQALQPPSNLVPTTSNAVSIRELWVGTGTVQPTLYAQASQPPSNLVPTPSNVVSIRGLSINAVAARSFLKQKVIKARETKLIRQEAEATICTSCETGLYAHL